MMQILQIDDSPVIDFFLFGLNTFFGYFFLNMMSQVSYRKELLLSSVGVLNLICKWDSFWQWSAIVYY